MNPPSYNSVANELLPRLMFKLGKFLSYDNDELAILCQKLDDIEKCKSVSNDITLKFNKEIAELINNAYEIADCPQVHKNVFAIIMNYNPNVRMPTNAVNMLLSHIWHNLQETKVSTDIVTSASEEIICTNKVYGIITQSVKNWLSTNKDHYVIL